MRPLYPLNHIKVLCLYKLSQVAVDFSQNIVVSKSNRGFLAAFFFAMRADAFMKGEKRKGKLHYYVPSETSLMYSVINYGVSTDFSGLTMIYSTMILLTALWNNILHSSVHLSAQKCTRIIKVRGTSSQFVLLMCYIILKYLFAYSMVRNENQKITQIFNGRISFRLCRKSQKMYS